MQKFFPEYESFFGASHDRSGGFNGSRRQFGNLVLTRHSPVQVLNHLLPSPADPKSKIYVEANNRTCDSPQFPGAIRVMKHI
ncbi:MAG: hypothetical protein Ct9H300mP21_00230 [Pseudomonadota bacterium]|nr:MAG: hypothetical protein Ct9H300mP21_00230 [Pseudomonadota bacterium]